MHTLCSEWLESGCDACDLEAFCNLAPVDTFSKVFGLEDEPVKSVKMKVETRSGKLWTLPREFALCSLQFRFAFRVSVMFHCVEPHPQNKKTLNPTNVRFRLKARLLLS